MSLENSEQHGGEKPGEVDITGMAERGQEVPHGQSFVVQIDCERVRVETQHPKGELLLARVHKRPCAFELIAEFAHCDNRVIEPDETVDLRQRGLKGFITAHKEIVTIFIEGPEHPYQIERGEHSVAEILAKGWQDARWVRPPGGEERTAFAIAAQRPGEDQRLRDVLHSATIRRFFLGLHAIPHGTDRRA